MKYVERAVIYFLCKLSSVWRMDYKDIACSVGGATGLGWTLTPINSLLVAWYHDHRHNAFIVHSLEAIWDGVEEKHTILTCKGWTVFVAWLNSSACAVGFLAIVTSWHLSIWGLCWVRRMYGCAAGLPLSLLLHVIVWGTYRRRKRPSEPLRDA